VPYERVREKVFRIMRAFGEKQPRPTKLAPQLAAKVKDTPRPSRTTEEVAALCTSLHVHDVVLGCGKFLMQHPGTKFYRSLCVNACGAYREVPSPSSRKDIPGAVIQHVLSLKT
jgi:hypothetical protein